MRMLSPRARAAVQDWIQEKHEDDRENVLETLDSLPTGTAWVWSPLRGILQKTALRRIKTFDSYATPKPGETRIEPSKRKELDIADLGQQIASTAERAKAEDPKELRKEVARLRRELEQRPTEKEVETVTETVEVPVLANGTVDRLEQAVKAIADAAGQLGDATGEISGELRRISPARTSPASVRAPAPVRPAAVPVARSPRPPAAPVDGELKLGRAHRSILAVLDQRYGLVTTKRQLAVATGYSIKGGGFNNPLGALRSAGLIEGTDPIKITDGGHELIAGQYEPLPEGPELLDHWARQFGKAHGLILRELAQHYPNAVTKQDLADATGYAVDGGGFNNPLGKLRTLELIEGTGELRLTDAFGERLG
jgi:hypothetical protein